jgi:ribosome-interacting GTPase 1
MAIVIDLTADLELSLATVEERLAEIGVRPVFRGASDASDAALGAEPGSPAAPAPRPAILVGTRADQAGESELDALRALAPGAPVFAHPLGPSSRARVAEALCGLVGRIVVTARDPSSPDEPVEYAVPVDSTVRDLADAIHHELARRARKAKVWGESAAFPGQDVGLDHVLAPGDVVEIY